MNTSNKSRCATKAVLSFRWFGFPGCKPGTDLETAETKFLTVLFQSPVRLRNEYVESMAVAEFRRTLVAAQNGRLHSESQVKVIRKLPEGYLSEIRWQRIPVQVVTPIGDAKHESVLVRMYISEPRAIPEYFVAHHIHEKVVRSSNLKDVQTKEIETAVGYFYSGLASNWGIS